LTRREFISRVSGAVVAAWPTAARADRPLEHVLYFTRSAGYRHEVIPLSQAILEQLGRDSGAFDVTATEDTSVFTTQNLERYAAVIFYTSGEPPMSGVQKRALLDFVRSGGGFLGRWSAPRDGTDVAYHFGHGAISDLSPLCAPKRTLTEAPEGLRAKRDSKLT
jgi:hypothetical protein